MTDLSTTLLTEILVPATGGLISILLILNGFFIRGLVKKLQRMDETLTMALPEQNAQIKSLQSNLDMIRSEFHEFKTEIREINSLKADVAVLKYALTHDKKKEKVREHGRTRSV